MTFLNANTKDIGQILQNIKLTGYLTASLLSFKPELFNHVLIYLNINKANDEAFFNRGLAKNKLGLDFKGAVNDFTKAIEINPDDKEY